MPLSASVPRQGHGDDGFSLIEILVALTILAIATVTFLGVMTSLTVATTHHRGIGATDTVARDFGEAVKQKAIEAAAYTECPVVADLTPTFSAAGFTTTVNQVEYWIPAVGNPVSGTFTTSRATCLNYFDGLCATCDPGYQRVKYTVLATRPEFKGGQTTTQILLRRGNAL